MSEHRIDGILQPDGIQYTKEEEKELDKTMKYANPFESRTLRASFDLAVLKKHYLKSALESDFNAWANLLRKIEKPDGYFGPTSCDFTEQKIREARQEFDRLVRERQVAEEVGQKHEAKARKRQELTNILTEWIAKETRVFLVFQVRGGAVHIAGKVERFSGFTKPDDPAWLQIGCDREDKRDLFGVFDLTAAGWTLYSADKNHSLVISPAEIAISNHPLTDEEYAAMFGEAVKVWSE